jgi:hypothetical protein
MSASDSWGSTGPIRLHESLALILGLEGTFRFPRQNREKYAMDCIAIFVFAPGFTP